MSGGRQRQIKGKLIKKIFSVFLATFKISYNLLLDEVLSVIIIHIFYYHFSLLKDNTSLTYIVQRGFV